MDDCFVKYSYFCLPGLDDSFGQVWSSPISQFTISCPFVQGSSRVLHNLTLILRTCVLMPVLSVPRVMILLETGHIDSFFQVVCHVSFFDWSHRFRCQILLPINSRIPLLPFTFLKFSSLAFCCPAPHLEVFSSSLVLICLEPGTLFIFFRLSLEFQNV